MTAGNQKPTGFILKKPDRTRKTFQLIPYLRVDGKKVYQKALVHKTLGTINSRFLKGELSLVDAEMHIKKVLIPRLKNAFGVPEKLSVETRINADNFRVFQEFWNKVYRKKKMEDNRTARFELLRALTVLEPLSLTSSDIEDIQDHWDRKLKGTRHSRYGGRLNQLLKFLKRDTFISLDRVDKPETKWVTFDELTKILLYVPNPHLKDLYIALWGTGCRTGEIFPLTSADLKPNDTIYISKQLSKDLVAKPYTKNRTNHDTIVLPQAKDALKRWLSLSNKQQYRKTCIKPLIHASKKAFPNNKSKWISPHKLRHSFVHYLLSKQVSLYQIKDLIGDTLKTTEETYSGWVISSESLENVMSKLKG